MARSVVDTLLPTTMVGSYPRPLWYRQQLHGRHLMDAFKLDEFSQAYKDATRAVIDDQQRAGLDIVTDGQMYFDDYGAGIGSFLWYWYERIPGFEKHRQPNPELLKAETQDWAEHEALTAVGGTAVTSRVRPPEGGSGLVEMFKIAQDYADRPVKYSVGAGPGNLTFHVDFNAQGSAYKHPQDLAEDLAPIFNAELKALAAAGCEFIQLEDLSAWLLLEGPEEPLGGRRDERRRRRRRPQARLALLPRRGVRQRDPRLRGQDRPGPRVHVRGRRRAVRPRLRAARDAGRRRPQGTSQPTRRSPSASSTSAPLQIETEQHVADRMRAALEVVPAERLYFSSDCGMKALHRFNAEGKLRTLTGAVKTVRAELGAGVAVPGGHLIGAGSVRPRPPWRVRPMISRASAGVATSRPMSCAIFTTHSTISALDCAISPLGR